MDIISLTPWQSYAVIAIAFTVGIAVGVACKKIGK